MLSPTGQNPLTHFIIVCDVWPSFHAFINVSDAVGIPPDFRQLLGSMFEDERKSCPTCADLIESVQKWRPRPRSGTLTGRTSSVDRLTTWLTHYINVGDNNPPVVDRIEKGPNVPKLATLPTLTPPPSRYQTDFQELEFIVSTPYKDLLALTDICTGERRLRQRRQGSK